MTSSPRTKTMPKFKTVQAARVEANTPVQPIENVKSEANLAMQNNVYANENRLSNTNQQDFLAQTAEDNFNKQQAEKIPAHELLAREVRFLIMDLVNHSAAPVIMNKPIWIEEFTDLNGQTRSKLSAQAMLKELLIHEGRQYGLKVLEQPQEGAEYIILRGSFNRISSGLLVNARIIGANGLAVLNTAQRHLPMALFNGAQNTGFKDGVSIVEPN